MTYFTRTTGIGYFVAALLLTIPVSGVAGDSPQNRGGLVSGVSLEEEEWWAESDGFRSRLPLSQSSRIERTVDSQVGLLVAAIEDIDGSGPSLRLVEVGRGGELGELQETPELGRPEYLAEPSFVLDADGNLGELLWLAGGAARDAALYAASWNGQWSEPVVISPAGPGTQIALSSCAMGNNDGLAVWVAYDGSDDELMWTVGGGGQWSEPRRITNNSVPDIMPTLACTSGGALAVWSWYDGNDYRLVTSQFRGETWSSPLVVGPKGSAGAAFVTQEPLRIVFQQVLPRGWGAFELETNGTVTKSLAVESPEIEMPRLVEVSRDEVILEWSSKLSRRAFWGAP